MSTHLRQIRIEDATSGETARVTNGGLDVNIQDQTTQVVNLKLSREVQAITVVTNTSIGDYTITVSSAGTPAAGNIVCLKEGVAFYQGEILSVVANGANWDLSLDSPLDYAYTTAGGCSERSVNMNVDGSVTPVEFSISPSGLDAGTEWDVVRVLGTITDGDSMDDAKFGGIAALTRGCVLRVENTHIQNLFNIKSNSDWRLEAYDVTYSDKAPAGKFGFSVRRTYGGQSKSGVVVRLSADSGDELKLIVQDDLTGLDTFYFQVQGHVTD